MEWRDKLDPTIREHFEELIKKVSKEKASYKNAQKPSQAQLWTAIAVLAKELSDTNLRIQKLEKQIKPKNNVTLKKDLEQL